MDGFDPRAVRVAVVHRVRDGEEGGGVCGAFGRHADGGGDVGSYLDVRAWLGGDGKVHGRVGKGAFALAGVVVLDQGGEGVEFGGGGIPADQNLFGAGSQVQGEHALLVLHVDFDLVGGFGVADCEGGVNGDAGVVAVRSGAEKGADDTGLVGRSAHGVVEY